MISEFLPKKKVVKSDYSKGNKSANPPPIWKSPLGEKRNNGKNRRQKSFESPLTSINPRRCYPTWQGICSRELSTAHAFPVSLIIFFQGWKEFPGQCSNPFSPMQSPLLILTGYWHFPVEKNRELCFQQKVLYPFPRFPPGFLPPSSLLDLILAEDM